MPSFGINAVGWRVLPIVTQIAKPFLPNVQLQAMRDVGQPTFSQVGRLPEFRLFFFVMYGMHTGDEAAHMLCV